jgi:hypothetical protein
LAAFRIGGPGDPEDGRLNETEALGVDLADEDFAREYRHTEHGRGPRQLNGELVADLPIA